MTATESQRHFNLTECSLNHKYNSTISPQPPWPCLLPSLTVIGETQTSSPPKPRPLSRVFPDKHPVRCYCHFVSAAGMMDLSFPEDVTPVGLDSWQAAVGGSTTLGHRWRSPGRLPTLASIISFLDVRSQKSEVFQQLKVLGL